MATDANIIKGNAVNRDDVYHQLDGIRCTAEILADMLGTV